MDKMKYTLRLLGGVTLFLVCGCHSPYSYQPYGYTGTPGFYAPQQQLYPGGGYPAGTFPGAIPGAVYPGTQPGVIGGGAYPGATYPVSPGGILPGVSGQPLIPDSTVPGGTYDDPLYAPGGGDWQGSGSDTLDDDYGDTFDNGGNSNPVPTPQDLDDGNFFREDDLGSSTDSFGARPDDNDSFEQPVAARKPIQSSRYGFDKVEYRWLKGILKRDPESNRWRIVYDLDGQDRFGGDLLVAHDKRLDASRDGDLFELRGYLDQDQTGPNGEPIYRVTAASIFKPKQIH